LARELGGLIDSFLRIERLQDVVVGADFGSTCLVEGAMLAGHQNNGRARKLWVRLDGAGHLVPVDPGQRRIDECDVRTKVTSLLKCKLAAFDGQQLRVFPRESHLHDLPHGHAVFDDQNPHRLKPRSPRCMLADIRDRHLPGQEAAGPV